MRSEDKYAQEILCQLGHLRCEAVGHALFCGDDKLQIPATIVHNAFPLVLRRQRP